MNIWLVMLLGGLTTFGMRFSLIYLLTEGRFEIPGTIRSASQQLSWQAAVNNYR